MKKGSKRLNNGYIGKDRMLSSLNGVLTPQKTYLNKLNALSVEPPDVPYVRPAEWEDLPSISSSEEKFAGVYAVYNNDSNFVALMFYTSTGQYTVDWGDGTTSDHNSATVAYKKYDSSTYSTLTSDVFRNYKTLVITVTPKTAGATLTRAYLDRKHNQAGLNAYHGNQWLDVRMAGSYQYLFISSTSESNATQSSMLEQIDVLSAGTLLGIAFGNCFSLENIVNFPSTKNVTSFGSVYYRCYRLKRLPPNMWQTQSSTYFGYCFVDCYNLREVDGFDTSSVTNANGLIAMFASCRALRKVGYFSTAGIKRLSQLFQNCNNLEEIPSYFDTSSSTHFNLMFYGCTRLKKIPILSDTSLAADFSSMFSFCYSLKEVPLIDTSNGTNFTEMFYGCYSLEKAPLLDTSSGTNFYRMFRDCQALREIPALDTSSGTNFSEMFYNCFSLRNNSVFPLLDTSSGTNFQSMFQLCRYISELPALDFSSATNMTNTFATCRSLSKFSCIGPNLSFSLSDCRLGPDELNEVYTNLPTVTSKTITVTGNWGTASDNPTIATTKGWTVTG